MQEERAGLLGSQADLKLGALLNTVQVSLYLHIMHTYEHLHTHRHSGLRNGPTYVALALWLNGPPCKWSGGPIGKLFHRQGPATAKLLSPNMLWVRGTVSVLSVDE